MREFIYLLLNTVLYPLLFTVGIFLIIELISFFKKKKFISMNPTKKRVIFYFIWNSYILGIYT